ncbi:MAG: methyltransferase domain-containing protein [Candidatus Acidiferrales bacterium]
MPPDPHASGVSRISWDPQDYARNSRIQEEYGRKQLAQLALTGNEAVLDIGCGDGRLTALLAQMVPRGRVLGIDSSPDMIAAARETHLSRHSNLAFELIDATALPFQSEFDLVFSTSALHWVKDHVPVLQGIRRALKPKGKMYLTFAARGTLAAFVFAVAALAEDPHWAARFDNFEMPYGFYGLEEYRALLDRFGFVVERLELVERDVTHEGREAFEGWMRTTGMPYLHRVEPERRQAFMRELIDRYLEKHPIDAQGLIHVKMVNLLVKAEKSAD